MLNKDNRLNFCFTPVLLSKRDSVSGTVFGKDCVSGGVSARDGVIGTVFGRDSVSGTVFGRDSVRDTVIARDSVCGTAFGRDSSIPVSRDTLTVSFHRRYFV